MSVNSLCLAKDSVTLETVYSVFLIKSSNTALYSFVQYDVKTRFSRDLEEDFLVQTLHEHKVDASTQTLTSAHCKRVL